MGKIEDIVKVGGNIEAVCDLETRTLYRKQSKMRRQQPSPGIAAPTFLDRLSRDTSQKLKSIFKSLKFRVNMKIRRSYKRIIQQLCFFNKAVANSESNTQKVKKHKINQSITSKKKESKIDTIVSNSYLI